MTKLRAASVTVAALALVVAVGCSQKYSAERDGKKLGQAICGLREATTREDAEDALGDINTQLEDLNNKYAMFTAEDRQDIQNNLGDLVGHVSQGQTNLAQQDLTVLERSARNIAEDVNETSSAAWDGVLEGLADCTQ